MFDTEVMTNCKTHAHAYIYVCVHVCIQTYKHFYNIISEMFSRYNICTWEEQND